MLAPLLLLLAALAWPSASSAAEPIVLIEPGLAPERFPLLNPKLAASPDGFLLSGMASHRPFAIPLSDEGEPQIVGLLPLTPQGMAFIGTPVFAGERWLVPYTPDFNNPKGTTIVALDRGGRVVTGRVSIPADDSRGVSWLSSNGRTFALVRGFVSSVFNHEDLEVVALSSDLVPVGDPVAVAEGTKGSRLAATAEGFLLVYSKWDGLWAQRLDDAALPSEAAIRLTAAPELRDFEIAEGAEGLLIAWSEASQDAFSIRAAMVPSAGAVEHWGELATVSGGSWAHAFPARLNDGWVVAWQGVSYTSTQSGSPILLRRFTAAGTPLDAPSPLVANPRGEVLRAVASRGDSVLFAWDRQLDVSRPFFGTLVTSDSIAAPRPLRLGWEQIEDISFAGSGTGDLYGAWEERGGVESAIRLGRWSREGEFLGGSVVRSAEGLYGSLSLAWGPGHGVLVWNEGPHVLGILVDDQARPAGEMFFIQSRGEPGWQPFFGPLHIVWDGSKFIVTWSGGGAFLTPGMPPLEIAAPPPSPNEGHYFGIDSPEVASAGDRLAIVAELSERFDCPFPGCAEGTTPWVAVSFTDAAGTVSSWDELIPSAHSPAIATNGETFLLSFVSFEGIQARLYGLDGTLLNEQTLFRTRSESTTVLWDGSRYVVGWSYRFGGAPRTAAAQLDREGRLSAPLVGFAFGGGTILAATVGGDAMLIGRATIEMETGSAPGIVGGLLSEGELLPPPPSAPAVQLEWISSDVVLSWTPVDGVEYRVWVALKRGDDLVWSSVDIDDNRSAHVDLEGLDADHIRLESSGLGGATVLEISLAPGQRRRAVGR